MPIPIQSATLAEVCAPLPIVRRLLAENQAGSSAANVSDYFRAALDGKWDQVRGPTTLCLLSFARLPAAQKIPHTLVPPRAGAAAQRC
jgi:hypothetical protein